MKKILIMAGILMMLGACSSVDSQKNLQNEKVLKLKDVSTNDYLLVNVFPNKGITIGFDTDKRVFGYTGLNRYFGKVILNDDFIMIDSLATTRMGGSKERFVIENLYLNLLKSMRRIKVVNDKIILSNHKGETLEFLPINNNTDNK